MVQKSGKFKTLGSHKLTFKVNPKNSELISLFYFHQPNMYVKNTEISYEKFKKKPLASGKTAQKQKPSHGLMNDECAIYCVVPVWLKMVPQGDGRRGNQNACLTKGACVQYH